MILAPQREIKGFGRSFKIKDWNSFLGKQGLRIEEQSVKGTGIHPVFLLQQSREGVIVKRKWVKQRKWMKIRVTITLSEARE